MTDTELAGTRENNDTIVEAVITFWKQAGADGHWFDKSESFDVRFRERFLALHVGVAAGHHDGWMETARGALALLILTDQYPRNAFRGTVHMYATDQLARRYAKLSHALGYMEQVEPDLRLFFCLPFAHSENLADQDLSVRLNQTLGEPFLGHAIGHRDIIRQFGRFPHRNAILGRVSTPAEHAFLASGGFAG